MNHQTSMFSHQTQIPRSPFASTLTLVFHAVLGLAVILVTAIPSIPKAHKRESLTYVTAEVVPDLPRFEIPPAPVPVPKPVVEIPRPESPKAFEAPAIEKPAPVPPPPPPAPAKKIEPPREVPVPKPEVTVGAFDNNKTATRVEPKARVEAAGFEQNNRETARVKPELQALDALNIANGPRSATQKTVMENPGFGATPTTTVARGATLTEGPLFNAEIRTRPAANAPQAQGAAGFSTDAPSRPAASVPGKTASAGFGTDPTAKPSAAAPKPVAQTASFTDTPAAPRPAPQAPPPPPRADRPVEILGKPAPAYTDEARAKGVEGDVLLEVEFTADGQVRVLRVVRGLGYGLDEMAQRAAEKIRFKPATSKGSPVDFRANLTIVFRLT